MKLKHIFMPVLYVEECYFSILFMRISVNRTCRITLQKYVIRYLYRWVPDGVVKPIDFLFW